MNRLSLNQNCKDLSLNLSLLDFLNQSKKFRGVELNFKSIREYIADNQKLKDLFEVMETFDLTTTSVFKLKDFNLCSDREFKIKIIPKFNQMIGYCYKLESGLVIIQPSFFTESQVSEEIPRRRIINRTTKRLTELSKIAKDSDIKIGFEFLNLQDSSVSSLTEVKEILQPLESLENVGYVIDCFHFIKSNEDISLFKDIIDYLFIIQLCDLKYTSITDLSTISKSDRCNLGEGNFNVNKFIENLRKLGYRRDYSIELYKTDCSKLYKKVLNYFAS